MSDEAKIDAGRDINAENVVAGIQQNFVQIFQQPFQSPPDLDQLRHDYLTYLQQGNRYLDMRGIPQVQRVIQQLTLASVYVPLKATSHQVGDTEWLGRIAGRWQRLAPDSDLAGVELVGAAPGRTVEPAPVEIALKTDPAVVVLGDPGAGKSTLLRILALALAQQPDGPLPILLPLNAYAKRLQQSRVNLSRFLGEYYAARQEKLAQVGDLFAEALENGQAVILLDGLDEVQANRPYLVRLVEDFADECIPQPANTPDAPPVLGTGAVLGNRIIVTSRFVGYKEAPLAGRQWRTYYLTDFNQADIKQFVRQWTLAFAISVQGDSEPTRQAAERERHALEQAIFSRPSVEQLASNPLMLTILALIKYTGVTLPERRVELYELYLKTFIESWNQARALDKEAVGPLLQYTEYVQVLAPLALWLRRENPQAGLASRRQLETWLTNYYQGEEWGLPKGEARQRADDFLKSVENYTNLLLERGERQYGFLHLTLEEMLAAKGISLLADDDLATAQALMRDYLLESAWHETLQLAVGVVALINQRPKTAGAVLQDWLEVAGPVDKKGQPTLLAGEALLDVGATNVGRVAAQKVTAALVETMQDAACPIRTRRDAGDLLGRLGWTPEPAPDDLLLAPAGVEPTGLDVFRPIQTSNQTPGVSETPGVSQIWLGKYSVTNRQFARFVEDNGYERREFWSEEGWAWRTGMYDGKAPDWLQDWLKSHPPEKRSQPYWWEDRQWNSPLYPVVGVSWFEAEAYCRWLTAVCDQPSAISGQWQARLPHEAEWEAAMRGRGEYPWGDDFDLTYLNCADSWAGRELLDDKEWRKWFESDERQEAGLTAVTTYPQGASLTGVWDGSGNVWERVLDIDDPKQGTRALCGGSWFYSRWKARVSYHSNNQPGYFDLNIGFRIVVAPVWP